MTTLGDWMLSLIAERRERPNSDPIACIRVSEHERMTMDMEGRYAYGNVCVRLSKHAELEDIVFNQVGEQKDYNKLHMRNLVPLADF